MPRLPPAALPAIALLVLGLGGCGPGTAPPTATVPRNAPAARTAPVRQLLPYNDRLDRRDLSSIDLVVVHCTELPTLAEAREYGERILYAGTGTGNSGHYYVDRDGAVYQYVEDDRVAHHVAGHNPRSIGIELVNRGRHPNWLHAAHQEMTEDYPPAQVAALIDLIADLRRRLPGLAAIARHSDLDPTWVPAVDDPARQVRRKVDPGPRLPWDRVVAASGLAPVDGRPPGATR
ncbi:MAG TPA: N-acetylmuramoyl-L-alanine amidase [Thermoanaerobaculia bacterium]|nr:N-acetylmuramoyl-L-alanine amidase [Thermoanaerobaculia bacterium]